jgi:hypothetical protein
VKFVGLLVQVTRGKHGGVVSPSQKSFSASQNSPVRPTGQLHDITRNVEIAAAVSPDVASGTKHSPPLTQRQSVMEGESVELPFLVS